MIDFKIDRPYPVRETGPVSALVSRKLEPLRQAKLIDMPVDVQPARLRNRRIITAERQRAPVEVPAVFITIELTVPAHPLTERTAGGQPTTRRELDDQRQSLSRRRRFGQRLRHPHTESDQVTRQGNLHGRWLVSTRFRKPHDGRIVSCAFDESGQRRAEPPNESVSSNPAIGVKR